MLSPNLRGLSEPIFFDVLETNTQQRFGEVDDGFDLRCRFYVLVSKRRHWTSLVGFRCCLTIGFSFLNINEHFYPFSPNHTRHMGYPEVITGVFLFFWLIISFMFRMVWGVSLAGPTIQTTLVFGGMILTNVLRVQRSCQMPLFARSNSN
jgi:hypothetical protein